MYLIRSGAIEGYEKLVYQLGYNPHKIMQQLGMSSAQLREPEALISYVKVAELLELTAQACNDPIFSLKLAAKQTAMAIGELVLSTSQQPTLRESIQFSNEHMRLHARGVHLALTVRGEIAEIHLNFDFTNANGLQQLILLSVAQIYNALTALLGEINPLLKMDLQTHLQEQDRTAIPNYSAHLNVGSTFNGIHFPSAWLDRENRNSDQMLQEHFNKRIQLLESIYPEDLQAQVRYICSNLLSSGECSIERVSAALNLHPRVLQKRLKSEGTSFSHLLQLTRTMTAQQQLLYGSLSVMDIALNLGYSEASVFCRNFKKWTGLSPRQWSVPILPRIPLIPGITTTEKNLTAIATFLKQ
ncbi:helix-turn-helix transcriptional regulator [Alkalimarinus sediminis]|uniref:AraC family transcriptional regulator n=1 Tax=Alkalimarinus sediminis TaxID=1632866 RepID=A0A9E8HLG3_9ALTE|nr:AraC family transcriptional regulator [Alkalimarinus sediminis]UZW75522.1 AraC family transcriptional regulator [Alkalimarinus sediminis]